MGAFESLDPHARHGRSVGRAPRARTRAGLVYRSMAFDTCPIGFYPKGPTGPSMGVGVEASSSQGFGALNQTLVLEGVDP